MSVPSDHDSSGEQLRDQAVEQVLSADVAVHRGHRDQVERVIAELIRSGAIFSADDVNDRLDEEVRRSISTQLVPALFRAAAVRGEIIPVGFTISKRPQRHAGVLRQWVGATANSDSDEVAA